jgi:ADP-heptose:LPS heptosyltransferase
MALRDSMTSLDTGEKTRVVVFHNGALGDFLLAASAIEELAEASTGACVDFWSKREHVALLAAKNYVGHCHYPDDALVACLLQDSLWQTVALPDFLVQAHKVFIFGQGGSRVVAERLGKRLSANVSWIQSFPAADNTDAHVSRFLQKQLAELGYSICGKPIRLLPDPDEKGAVEALLAGLGAFSPPILVHPGSGGRRKIWPIGNWYALIEWMRSELPCQVLLSMGPADGYLSEFARAMREAGVPVISGLSAVRLCSLLSLCGLYIGSDSGVSHLAAATGIPAIAVFGPTDPRVWGPRGSNAVAVRRRWEDSEDAAWTPQDQNPPRTRSGAGQKPPGTRIFSPDREIADLILAMLHNGTPEF